MKAHLSVLLAVLALLKAVGYCLQRFELVLLHAGAWSTGASYTDVKAQLPALNLLICISPVRLRAVPRQHLAPGLGAARHRRRPVGPRLGRRRRRLPGVRPEVPGRAHRVHQGAAVHRAQHHGHPDGLRPRRTSESKDFDDRNDLNAADLDAERRPPSATSGSGTRRSSATPTSGCRRSGTSTSSTTSTSTATTIDGARHPGADRRPASSTSTASRRQSWVNQPPRLHPRLRRRRSSPANGVTPDGKPDFLRQGPAARRASPTIDPARASTTARTSAATPSSTPSSRRSTTPRPTAPTTRARYAGNGGVRDELAACAGPRSPCASATSTR